MHGLSHGRDHRALLLLFSVGPATLETCVPVREMRDLELAAAVFGPSEVRSKLLDRRPSEKRIVNHQPS